MAIFFCCGQKKVDGSKEEDDDGTKGRKEIRNIGSPIG